MITLLSVCPYLPKNNGHLSHKNEYFEIIKGIKINRVLPVDLESWNLTASIYRLPELVGNSGKNLKTHHLWLNPKINTLKAAS